MLRTITALLLLATIVPVAEAQCPGGRCQAPQAGYSPGVFHYGVGSQYPAYATPAYRVVTASPQSVVPTPQAATTDPYAFGQKLNHARAQYYRKALAYDPALSAIAAANSSKGFGHHGGHHGRENVGMGSLDAVMASWLASPSHASALLDPSLSRYGIANVGGIWTFIGVR